MSETASRGHAHMHVVAGILMDPEGRVLLAQRPAGKHQAGLWEFPGGKRKPGETSAAALVRELHEELGIEAEPDVTLIVVPWQDGSREMQLEAIEVPCWQGRPESCEGQALRWVVPADVDPGELTPADRPILELLRG